MADPRPVRLCLGTLLFHPVYAGGAMRFARYLPGLAERGILTDVFTSVPDAVRTAMSELGVTSETQLAAAPAPAASPGKRPTQYGWLNGDSDARIERVSLPNVRSRTVRDIAYGRKLVRFCSAHGSRPNVVQLLAAPPGMVPALLRLRRMGIASVSHVTVSPTFATGVLASPHQWFYTKPMNLLDCIIVSSRAMKAQLLALGVTAPMVVIPNGVDTARFHPPKTRGRRAGRVRRRLGIGAEDTVLLAVGAVSPRKRTDLLLEAWCLLAQEDRRLHLVVAGPRSDQAKPALEDFRGRLEALVRDSGAGERIHFVGLVDDVEEYYREADAFVFSSRREGMPNAVLEAMASGLPVITTPFLGLAEELGRAGEHYLLVEPTADGLAAGVRSALDHGLSDDMAEAGRAWVVREMAFDRVLDRYAELYREMALRRPRAELSPPEAGWRAVEAFHLAGDRSR